MDSSLGPITAPLGRALVELARRTLAERFGRRSDLVEQQRLNALLEDPALKLSAGTFVTLKKGGKLRGCIGSLVGHGPIPDGVRQNALNAAFHDPRFAALTAQELDRISIEVSILTPPFPLSYTDADDLIAKLRPHVDGVTIRKDYAGATFLPQVWEQLPRPHDFLSHLCLKAGLKVDAWRNMHLEVDVYQVQYFEEEMEAS